MSNFLIELAAIHLLLICGYLLLLRKERQYGKQRFYLISSSLFSLLIPLIKLPNPFFKAEETTYQPIAQSFEIETIATNQVIESTNWGLYVFITIYASISVFFLFRFLKNLLHILRLQQKSSYQKFNNQNVLKVAGINVSFSFFKWIFLSNEVQEKNEEYDVILNHEKAHVTLGHTYDLIYLELLKICFWWLPSIWYSIKEIKKIHEYQADAYALKFCSIDRYSSILISSTLKTNGLGMASSFHDGLILKRLEAMKEREKRSVSPWKIGSLSVLLTFLFMAFACTENPATAQDQESETFTIVEGWAQYPGGMTAFYQYLMEEINYPKQARTSGIEGRTWVQFTVEKDGSVAGVQTVKGIGGSCDEEVERALKSASSFDPAQQRGKTVRVQMVIPVTFQLKEGETNPDGSPQGVVSVGEITKSLSNLKVKASHAEGVWSGTIYDDKTGDVLPGANIVVEGTNLGTVSDLDGTFQIKTEDAKNIAISFVGYENVKLQAK